MKMRNKMRLFVAISGLILLVLFVCTPSLLADIQVDAVNSNSTSGGSSITIPLTVSGSNRLMLVGVSLNPNYDEWVSSVTWKGTENLTLDGRVIVNDNDARVEIWKLVPPTTGSGNVVVTFSAPLAAEAVAGAITFTGVHQTTPLGAFASAIDSDTTSATVDVDSAAGEFVFGVVACEYDAVITDPSQTEHWNISVNGTATNGAGSTEAGAAPTVATSWTLVAEPTPSNHWAVGGVSIKPAVGEELDVWVTASDDDSEEYKSGGYPDWGSSDLELPNEGGTGAQWIGMRFQNITIPKGSSITNAYVQFTADVANSEATNLTIYGQDIGTAPAFLDAQWNVSSRARTLTTVNWTPNPWVGGDRGVDQRTPDISSIIEAIVGRGDWVSGNDLVIIIDGTTGEREAESYEGATGDHGQPIWAPMLHIEYEPTLIELSSFTATPLNSAVLLEWATETELDNEGFNLLRSEEEGGEYVKINRNFIPSKGEAGFGAKYSHTDYDVENGVTYYYLLEDIDFYGKSTLHGPVSATPNDIVLIWPIEWEPVPSGSSLFMWASSGNFSFKVEVSPSASFPASETITFPEEGWTSDFSYWLRPEEWEVILRKAQASGGHLFWRVRAKGKNDEVVFSDWGKFFIEYLDGNIAVKKALNNKIF
jgi:hypothetical protein